MQDQQNQAAPAASNAMPATPASGPAITGLSGNELYCVDLVGYRPGHLLVGNSVFSRGFVGALGSGFKTLAGGEITQVTNMIAEGRHLSLQRMVGEMQKFGAVGASGVTSELIFHGNSIEFLSVASGLHPKDGNQPSNGFTTASDGQELFCQLDAGYNPLAFVMGNVAYSIGIGRGIGGMFKQLAKGEVRQYSDMYAQTRNLALQRIVAEAQSVGADAVLGIKTNIMPFESLAVQEMLMVGTAAKRADGKGPAGGVITSDLTAEEMWNITKLGYTPIQLVMGTSVYSMGFIGGFKAALRNWVKGEITEMTQLIYDAREESIGKVQAQAQTVGADDVLGVKTYIYDIGSGLVEFLAIGTAVRRDPDARTKSEQLPPQAIIRDKETFVNSSELSYGVNVTQTAQL